MPEDDRAATPSLDSFAKYDQLLLTESVQTNSEDSGDLFPTVATVAVVGIGAAVFEAALLPGLVLGVAAIVRATIFFSNWLGVGSAFQIHGTQCIPDWPEDPRSGCRGSRADPGHRRGSRRRKGPRPYDLEDEVGGWIARLTLGITSGYNRGLFLMLWTAPPLARECHRRGCR
jgi:hypothetical protein